MRAVALLTLIGAATAALFAVVPAGFMPEEDKGYALAAVMLPDAASLQRTAEVMKQVEAVLAEVDAIENVTTVAGFSSLTGTIQPNSGFVFIQLKHWDERPDAKDHARNVVRRINAAFATRLRDGIAFAFGPPAIPGLGSGSGFSMMIQDRSGNTPDYLESQTTAFTRAASQRPEIANATSLYRAGVSADLPRHRRCEGAEARVSLDDVSVALGAFLGGAYVNDFNRFGRLYKVYVQAEPDYRADAEALRFFYVRNSDGAMVPLSTLISDRRTFGPEFTNRFNLFRAAEVTGQPAPGYSSAQALAALEQVADEVLPPDMSFAWNAISYQEVAAAGSAGVVFAMALVFVFLILAAQYESWSLPLSVLFSVPIAIFGAMGGLAVSGLFSESYVNNVFAQIGLVMLIGMAAKNAILIVEFAKVERESGKSAVEAAMEAARQRFRPILMTAFSFILACCRCWSRAAPVPKHAQSWE